jgi:ribosomal protein L11 methyltransferase
MPFLQLILPIGAADPAPYEDALLIVGASSITLEDEGDDPVLEPLPGTTPLWPRVRLKALFDAERLQAHAFRPTLVDLSRRPAPRC